MAKADPAAPIHADPAASTPDQPSRFFKGAREVFVIIFLIFYVAAALIFLIEISLYLLGTGFHDRLKDTLAIDIIYSHWPAIFALPLLTFFALSLVFITKLVAGELTFTLGPAKISGAASEGLMFI